MPEVHFTERELEDFLCKDDNLIKYLGIRFVARQVNTDNGIVDILGFHVKTKKWVVIELKKDVLNADAFFQVHRYIHYFNFKRNEYGKRDFIPLIIGRSLSEKLAFNVLHYEKNDGYISGNVTYYTCFNIEFDKPINFTYYSTHQMEIQDGEFYE